MKIVINRCHGGFGLSPIATKMAVEAGVPCKPYKYTQESEYDKGESKQKDLGGGWEVWGHDRTMFAHVVKEGMVYYLSSSEISFRSHPGLVATVERLKEAANGECAQLEIVEVPDDAAVQIEDYDGAEHVAEKHRTW